MIQKNNLFQRIDQLELQYCLTLNKLSAIRPVRQFFVVVSRLGNGLFWYSLMLVLPLIYGQQAWNTSMTMAITGVIGVVIYKILKTTLLRERPYIHHAAINQGTVALDYYSFPSGHTLHAVSFSLIAINSFPELALLLVPFTLLIALSRVVLGLHYPTDVLVGAGIGTFLSIISI